MFFPSVSIVLAAVAAALLVFPLSADETDSPKGPAALFEQLDADKDGKLTKDEVGEERARFFDRMVRVGDQDEDGVLTKEEFLKANQPLERPAQPANSNARRRGFGQAFYAQFINRYDKDGDGKLKLSEVPEDVRPRLKSLFDRIGKDEITEQDIRSAYARQSRQSGSATDFFKRLDTDGDGKISLAEAPERAKSAVRDILKRAGKEEDGSVTLKEFISMQGETMQRMIRDVGGPGSEVTFKGFDANGDGKLTVEETPQRAKIVVAALLRRLGKQPDESLTLEEFQKASAGGTPRNDPPGLSSPSRNTAAIVRILDADKNGQISKQELSKAADHFDKLDRNGDGQLSAQELMGFSAARGFGGGNNRPNLNPPTPERFVNGFLDRYDGDKNGTLDLQEIPERSRERYASWDADKNGKLSKEELTKGFGASLRRFRNRSRENRRESDRPERPQSDN